MFHTLPPTPPFFLVPIQSSYLHTPSLPFPGAMLPICPCTPLPSPLLSSPLLSSPLLSSPLLSSLLFSSLLSSPLLPSLLSSPLLFSTLPFPSLPFPSLPYPTLPFPYLPLPLPLPSLPFPSLPTPSACRDCQSSHHESDCQIFKDLKWYNKSYTETRFQVLLLQKCSRFQFKAICVIFLYIPVSPVKSQNVWSS